jgi:hypothetical protein
MSVPSVGQHDTLERATLRREAVRALGTRSGGPLTEDTQRLLIALLDDPTVGTQAAYGLGAEAYRRREAEGESKAFLQPLLEAMDGGNVRVLLKALGNAGSAAALPRILPLINSDSPVIAAAAVQALRRMPSNAAVEAAFLQGLSDRRPAVQQAALRALEFRAPTSRLRDQVGELAGKKGPTQRLAQRVLDRWAQN